jgi:photosystem II stability/assembly factor-like uncharacterized protein
MLNAAFTADENRVWVVGARGSILHTTDGGTAWTVTETSRKEDLWDIAFASATRGWIVGDRGVLIETTDSGASWQLVEVPTKSGLYGLAVRPPSNVVAVGEKGTLITSERGWSATQVAEETWNAVAVSRAGPSGPLAIAERCRDRTREETG